MQSVTTDKSTLVSRQRRARSNSDLVSLSAPVLQLVLKLKAEIMTPSAELRPSFERMLEELEQRGKTLRYGEQQVQAVKFALVAFVDETMLTAKFPRREDWEKYPLQLKLFGEHLAGNKFFDRLEELLKQGNSELDVVEVYYLCLLLGYKGKYKFFLEVPLKGVIENVAEHLRRAGRLREGELSQRWKATDQPELPQQTGLPRWIKTGGIVGFGLLLLLFALLNFLRTSDLYAVKEQLLH